MCMDSKNQKICFSLYKIQRKNREISDFSFVFYTGKTILMNFGIHAHRNVLHMNFQNCSITFKSFLKCYLGLVVIRKTAQNVPEVLQITLKKFAQFFGNQCPHGVSRPIWRRRHNVSHTFHITCTVLTGHSSAQCCQ